MQIVFGRKITAASPGRFRTRIVSPGVHPQLHAHYDKTLVEIPDGQLVMLDRHGATFRADASRRLTARGL